MKTNLNIIINGFFDEPNIKILLELFNKNSVHKITNLICIYFFEGFEKKIKIGGNCEFILRNKAIFGEYPGESKIPPLDEEIIIKMQPFEAIAIKMMDRLEDRYHKILSYDERKRLYYKNLKYWNYKIDEKKIDLFLSSTIPHEIYDYMIFALCKIKKIKTVFFYQTQIEGCSLIMEDWKDPVPGIKKKYSALKRKFRNKREEDIIISNIFKNHFVEQTTSKNPLPFYMDPSDPLYIPPSARSFKKKDYSFQKYITDINKTIFSNPRNFIRQIMKFSYWKNKILEKYSLYKDLKAEQKLFSFYDSQTIRADLTKNYIYFPLHYQPEATTSPMAGIFVDQLLTIEIISSVLPKGVYLYIKENAYQKSVGRSLDFYKDVSVLQNCKLIPRNYNSFELINKSIAVATATGTAGWEALLREKPVLLFGNCFYQYAPEVYQVKDKIGAKIALQKIISGKAKFSRRDVKIFLLALEKTAINGYIDLYSNTKYYSSEENNRKIIVKSLLEKLNNIL